MLHVTCVPVSYTHLDVYKRQGNDYFLTVQYKENGSGSIRNTLDLTNIPLRAAGLKQPTTLDSVVNLETLETPTEACLLYTST